MPPHGPPQPNIQFGIQFGTPGYGGYFPHRHHRYCLDDGEIYAALHDDGYYRIRLVDDRGDTLTFDARQGSRHYELSVDSCTGDILDRERIWHK
jgi:hypothetical protein